MERDKFFFRNILLHYFTLNKSVSETHRILKDCYDDQAPSHTTCKEWFRRFNSGDFDVNDKPRSGQPKKFNDSELQALLDVNSARTLKELGDELGVTEAAVSKRLRSLGKIQKEGKWIPNTPNEIKEKAVAN